MLKFFLLFTASFLSLTFNVQAETVLDYLTDANGKYTGPTVEDNVAVMDTDKNGFADVTEVRAFLEKKHGKGYESALFDRWELHSKGNSCHAPAVNELLIEK